MEIPMIHTIIKPFFLITILFLIGGCEHQDRSTTHYVRLKKVYGQLAFEYEKEAAIISNQHLSDNAKETALHKEIMINNDEYNAIHRGFFSYNEYANYPYLQYKTTLDHDLYRLSKAIQKSPLADEDIQHRARLLLRQLRQIKQMVLTTKKYEQERTKKIELDAQHALAEATTKSAYATVLAAHEAHHVAKAIESTPREQHHHYHSAPEVVVNIDKKEQTFIQ